MKKIMKLLPSLSETMLGVGGTLLMILVGKSLKRTVPESEQILNFN